MSRISTCVKAAPHFLLSQQDARAIAEAQIATIKDHWDSVCDEARLTKTDRKLFTTRQFLNPFVLEGF